MNPNPFKPTAGKRPPMLIGRESVIEDFEEGLDNGAGAPGRLIPPRLAYAAVWPTRFARINPL